MTTLDKNYLRLQFWNKVYKKDATEFQHFFEDIMSGAFTGFQKIKPYGNKGDGGNDGYRPGEGIYYQIYAPRDPREKEAYAANKLKEDFEKLKTNWDQISTIKEYYFVFNDKDNGVSIEIENALSELRKKNAAIKFGVFTPRNLEDIFFCLKEEQILALDFDIDSTNTLKITKEYLEKLEIDLDRDNAKFVNKGLSNIQSIVSSLNDESLKLYFEILEARTLQKLECIKEAKGKYEDMAKRYPDDPRPVLYLAEIALNNGDFKGNEKLLKKAEQIDKNNWLLALEKLIRAYVRTEKIDLSKVDEKDFPAEEKIKANFYRIYSGFYEEAEKSSKADSFIERAIKLNPDKFNSYDAKLSQLEWRMIAPKINDKERQERAGRLLSEVEKVEQKIAEWGGVGVRSRAILLYRKFNAHRLQENLLEVEQNAKDCFELVLQCYFDRTIDNLLVGILTFIELPDNDLGRLLKYLDKVEKGISDDLTKRIVFQFNLKNQLFTEGKKYFQRIGKQNILDFISNLEKGDSDKVIEFLSGDPLFAVAITNTTKTNSELRLKIIESLPDDGSVQKDKLLLLLNYDEGDIDKAFEILKTFDLSNLGYLEAKQLLKIAQKKKAWEFVCRLLEDLIKKEKNISNILSLKLQLFTANLNLGKFKEAAEIGEEILSNPKELGLLDPENKESLLGQTISARIKRSEFKDAKKLLEDHVSLFLTHNYVLGVKVDVYLKNNDPQKALSSIVEGIKLIKTPTPEQYGYLLLYFVEIGNMMDFPLSSLDEITDGCFVKLKDNDMWYFIGNGEELDATKIAQDDEKYRLFMGKKVNDKIAFKEKYRASSVQFGVEMILSIEKYILWQCRHNAEKLTIEKRWKAMEIIDVPSTPNGVDPKFLIARLDDDRKARGKFFEMYTQKTLPLAFLAVNQGGLTNAIGCIINEQKGYINFSTGNLDEINAQKEVARRIIAGEEFYIDGTSSLVLGETGLLKDIYKYLPNLRIPQSVITLLLEINDKFRYIPGQSGHMAYSQGRLVLSGVDQQKRKKIRDNFEKTIKLLESKPKNIVAISTVNKTGKFSEQRIDSALCDACILAQRDKTMILTEDHLYLEVNKLETKKPQPEYCSAFALIRVLYEQKKIDFDKYLAFFSYLSSYRFRFLPIAFEDIEKAVFGDGTIRVITPQNIRLLNFPLTLSENYGVSFGRAFPIIGRFLVKVLIDDSILPEMVNKIYVEIIETFPIPANMSKRELGRMLIGVSVRVINNTQNNIVLSRNIQKKVDSLSNLTEIYEEKGIVLP